MSRHRFTRNSGNSFESQLVSGAWPSARRTVSHGISNSVPGMATGLRRPFSSGSPSLLRMKTTPRTRPSAADDDVHMLGTQTPRRGGAVHRRIARAEDDHAFAHLDRATAVGALEEDDAGHHALGLFAGDTDVVRLEAARGDEHGVVLVVQLAERHVTTDVSGQLELDVLVDDAGDVAVDDLARQTERRHACEGRPAGLVERVVDGHAEAELRQVA